MNEYQPSLVVFITYKPARNLLLIPNSPSQLFPDILSVLQIFLLNDESIHSSTFLALFLLCSSAYIIAQGYMDLSTHTHFQSIPQSSL